MRNYVIPDKYKVKTNHGSKGCQVKYLRNNYWYKIDGSSTEGRNEHLASLILKCSNITDFVYYEACKVNNRMACRSYNFLADNEMMITLDYIVCSIKGIDNAENLLWSISDVKDRFNFLVDCVNQYTDYRLDITEYLRVNIYFDWLILNRDRHLNNLGIIIDTHKDTYRCAPIFDNGLSLLGGCQELVFEYGIEQAVDRQNSRTISGSFANQALVASNGRFESPIKIDFNKLNNMVRNDPNITNFQRNVLDYQCKNIGNLFR